MKKDMRLVQCIVNGKEVAEYVDVRESLLDMLRNRLGLTSVKKGCEVGECGACTVIDPTLHAVNSGFLIHLGLIRIHQTPNYLIESTNLIPYLPFRPAALIRTSFLLFLHLSLLSYTSIQNSSCANCSGSNCSCTN